MNELQQEWTVIHCDIEKYEQFSLLIKLFSVLVCLLCFAFTINQWLSLGFILILWLQDGIWKTFQQRSTNRILQIEASLSQSGAGLQPFGFYSAWQAQRQGAGALIGEYLGSALKPTVAYPYVLLFAASLALYLLT